MAFAVTEPKVENRDPQPYAGIRTQISMGEFPSIIPQYIDEVAEWLGKQGVAPDGPPIIRYHACPTMPGPDAMLDVAIGWPVANPLKGEGRIVADVLPAGRYASLVFTGVENGVKGNGVLVDWAKEKSIEWDHWDDPLGDAFRGRVEYMMDGPDDDPNPSNWRTEVAIKLADGQ
ncbi:MAG: GyrI-like domain-containing protein [Anaerolineae bacterium]|nr:GyrI-like domain-containing protein [Anaerolineae bacterium]